MQQALDFAFLCLAPELPFEQDARPCRCPVAAVLSVLGCEAVTLKVQAAHDHHMPHARLTAAGHAVDGRAVTLARAMGAHRERVPLGNLKSPPVLSRLSPVHCKPPYSVPFHSPTGNVSTPF